MKITTSDKYTARQILRWLWQAWRGNRLQAALNALLGVADVQRLDMGIAMCHFELSAMELGLKGKWSVAEPALEKPDKHTEYTVSWIAG